MNKIIVKYLRIRASAGCNLGKFFFFLIFLFLLSPLSNAQEPLYIFGKNDFENDMIYEQIENILIDSDGFTWLGTPTGLFQYDGYNLTTHRRTSHTNTSITENFVTTLFEDSRGLIWIGTYSNGVNVYDKHDKSFYNFTHTKDDESTISSNRIPRVNYSIAEDSDGFIWVNTDNGLNKIDPDTQTIERHHGNLEGQLLFHKSRNDFWIGGATLKCYNPISKALEEFSIPGVSDPITSIILDGEDLIWVGTNSGLFLFKISERTFFPLNRYYSGTNRGKLNWSQNPIKCLYKDFKDNVWIGVGKTIHIINIKSDYYRELANSKENEDELINDFIRGIYGDKNGTIQITYAYSGITKVSINASNFRRITNITRKSKNKEKKIARSILKDKNNNLWVGTIGHGLSRISESDNNVVQSYKHDPQSGKSLNSNYVTALYIDKGERLWVGTFENGFNYVDNFYESKVLNFVSSEFEGKVEIHEFQEDKAGRIWICTNMGLFVYDKDDESIIHYGTLTNQEAALKSINVQSMVQEKSNVFWLATWNSGVVKLIINSDDQLSTSCSRDSLIIYNEIKDRSGTVIGNQFINIHKGKNGDLWLASNIDGLVRMRLGEDAPVFESFNESKGAPSNQIYAIVEDAHGFLWLSSGNGIGKFNPEISQFSNFYETDGLHSNTLNWDAYFQATSGEIYFGGFDGITAFFPDSLVETDSKYKAFLSKLSINYVDVNVGDFVNNNFILNKDIRFKESITLTHQESVFLLEFGALNIANARDILFAYKLEGFDKDWIYTNAKNRVATYTNLRNGIYHFKLKASKNMGQWDAEMAVLKVIVLPPWWKTIWAYAIYMVIFLILLYLFQRELVIRAEMKHHLELEKYKHERDNEINREKFKFFTTLSHELRSPLTLILGPLDRIIRKQEANSRVLQSLLLVQNQAQRLLRLTTQIMNFRKYEIENLKLRAADGNVVEFLSEITIAFRQHARMKQIHFRLSHPDDPIRLYYDRDKFEIIIVNLLSNAFKFTPPNGTIEMILTQMTVSQAVSIMKADPNVNMVYYGEFASSTKNVIQIEISDTGIGIHPDQLQLVFERYFQASNIQSISAGGTGIGLEIVKNYVELHHGCVMVRSEVNKGTTFYVWMPMGKSHLSDVNIVPDFKPSEYIGHYTKSTTLVKGAYANQISIDEQKVKDKSLPTLLVVDDNPEIVNYLKENFEGSFNISTAQNGKIGLEKVFIEIPDLIISDIMMPEMDGLELCKHIKSDVRTSHIPVILLTARTSNLFQAEGLNTGADDYISKPFDEKILNIRVKNLIDSRRKLRERYSREINLAPHEITITQIDEKFLDRIIQIIEANLSDTNLKVEQIAREIGMSHSVLYKKIMALTDLSIVEFIRTIRLKRASELLRKTNSSIAKVSDEVGFTDPKYFSKCFQKQFGVAPKLFQKNSN